MNLTPWTRAGAYAFFMLGAAALGFAKTAVFAKALGAEGLGYVTLMTLIAGYGAYAANLGISDGLMRELPVLRGRGKEQEAVDLRDRSLAAVMALGAGALLFYLAAVAGLEIGGAGMRFTLLVSGVFALLNAWFLFAALELRVSGRLMEFSAALFLKAALGLALASAAGYYFGYEATLLAETAIAGLLILVMWRRWIPGLRPRWDGMAAVYRVAAVGAPVMVTSLLRNLAVSIDRWFVVVMFGVAGLGQYSFGMLVAALGLVVSNIISQYLGPDLMRGYGLSADLGMVHRRVMGYSLAVMALFAAGWAPFAFAVDTFGTGFFPGYEQGFALMNIIYLGAMFQTMNLFDFTLLAALRQKQGMALSAGVTALTLILCAAAWWNKLGMEAFAAIYSLGRFAHLAGGVQCARWVTKEAAA